MMRIGVVTAAVFTTVLAAHAASADVRLSITNGQVSLSATNATVAQILAEWAKAGPTRIVNGERVAGGPLTLELTNVSEVQALDIILRSASGYLLAPRPTAAANGSKFDRILILPTSNAPRAAAVPAAFQGQASLPQFARPPQPTQAPPPEADEADADRGAPVPPGQPENARPPTFTPFPQPISPQQREVQQPPPDSQPSATPTAPVGVPRPGMIAPSPGGRPGEVPVPQ